LFTSDIVLPDAAAANKTFVQIVNPNNPGIYRRLDSTTNAAAPRDFTIGHQAVTVKGVSCNKHLVGFRHRKANVVSAIPEEVVFNGTLLVPATTTFSTTDVYDILAFVRAFWTSANGLKLMNGES
jgi:hypothetical protein